MNPSILKRRDRTSAVFCLILGLAVLAQGIRGGLSVNAEMGPGFFPFLAGGMLSVLALVLLFRPPKSAHDAREAAAFWGSPEGRKWVLFTVAAVIIYTLVLNSLGFLLSTFSLLSFLFSARQKWWMAGLSGSAGALSAYLIFEVWLQANLPRGILSF